MAEHTVAAAIGRALREHPWDPADPTSAHAEHRSFRHACAVCMSRLDRIAEVAAHAADEAMPAYPTPAAYTAVRRRAEIAELRVLRLATELDDLRTDLDVARADAAEHDPEAVDRLAAMQSGRHPASRGRWPHDI